MEYTNATGQTMRREQYALSSGGQWALLENSDYTYDALGRETSYTYDAARRLIAIERSATETTPATVTAYRLDMAGRRIGTLVDTGELSVAQSTSYDTLGRPSARNTSRQGTTKNDTFAYNNRSELAAATVNSEAYSYAYDNIGNRKSAQEAAEEATSYTANELNQYTAIQQGSGEEAESFMPEFDLDGKAPDDYKGIGQTAKRVYPEGASRQWGGGESTRRK